MKNILLFSALSLYFLNAQDDLLDLIIEKEPAVYPVYATFKASRIVNAQSIELPRPKTLEFMILHRFGSMSNGFYDLFGTDQAVVRYDLKYGFNDFFSFGIGRSGIKKTYDTFSKIKLIRQKYGQRGAPFTLAVFSKAEIQTVIKKMDFTDRLTFDIQALIARKFSRSLSLQVMPTFIHRNMVEMEGDMHDMFSLGFGGRKKFTKRASFNFDTFFPIGNRADSYRQGWGLGFDIETGGHVFQLMVTNAQGSFESEYIENARGTLEGYNIYLGFNISRVFRL